MKKIHKFNFNTENISQNGETREFSIISDKFAVFSLEILNEDGDYYNFKTKTFSSEKYRIDNYVITNGLYKSAVTFPAVTDSDHYDIRLWAPNIYDTKHSDYVEVRNEDDSINLNASSGSNSNLLAKKIFQYINVEVEITPSVGFIGTDWGAITSVAQTITGNALSTNSKKYSFTTTATVAGDKGVTIIRQPHVDDIYTITQRQYGTAVEIPGEDLYSFIKNTSVTSGTGSSATDITLDDTCTTLRLVVGDAVVIGDYTDKTLLITHLGTDTGGMTDYQIRVNSSITWANDATVTFYYKGYYRWNIHADSSLHGLSAGVTINGGVKPYTKLSNYTETSERELEIYYKNPSEKLSALPKTTLSSFEKGLHYPAIEKSTIKPTYTSGVISKQLGIVTHLEQQTVAMANQTFKAYAYGRDKINDLTYCNAIFTNLKAELTEVTTNTSSAISNANLAVDDGSGVINNITRVKAIGIDGTSGYPLITAGAGTDGATTLTMDSSQNIEDNQIVTLLGTGSVVTITGDVEFKRFPVENTSLRLDVSKFLLMN